MILVIKYNIFNIFGLGGVGSHILLQLIDFLKFYRKYIDEDRFSIVLYDGDIIDDKFLYRVPEIKQAFPFSVGDYKVFTLRDYIGDNYSFKVFVYPKYITEEDKGTEFTSNSFSFITVDSLEARELIEKLLRNTSHCDWIHIGFDHHRLTLYKSISHTIDLIGEEMVRESSYEVQPTPFELRYIAMVVIKKVMSRIMDKFPIEIYSNW